VGVEEASWDKGGTEPADDYTFLCENGNADHHTGTGFFIYKGIIYLFFECGFIFFKFKRRRT
jgi:hypothetical protein